MEWLVFTGWVISQANEWEDYPNYYAEEAAMSRNWATAHFFGLSVVAPGTVMAPVGVILHMLIYYNKHIWRLKAHWKLKLLPSWI